MARNLTTGLQRGLRRSVAGGLGAGDLFSTAALDLRFAQQKTLDPRITFTRASSGTYVDSQGVIRRATTNLLLRSEELTTSPWFNAGVTLTNNSTDVIDPFGGTKSTKIVATGSGSAIGQGTIIGTASTGSIWLRTSSGTASFSLIIYLSGSPFTNIGTANITVTTAWQRFSVTSSAPPAQASYNFQLQSIPAGTLYAFGAQLEQSSTVGEYIPTTSTINSAPRFDHNPTTGESLGLLVEEQRTNLLVRSEEFDNATWSKNFVTTTANAAIAPNGTVTADSVVPSSTTTLFYTQQNVTTIASTIYTWSVYVKRNGFSWIFLDAYDGANHRTWFDLANGVVGTVEAGNTSTITPVGNDWYRCSLTRSSAGGSVAYAIAIVSGNNSLSGTGNSSNGIYAWGAQLEAGSFPTSYIPTTTAAVTRSADVASITGANFGVSRTNLVQQSADISNVYWVKTEATVTANAITAPDGTTTAGKLVESTNNSQHTLSSAVISWAGNTQYTATFFAKAGERFKFEILLGTGANWVNTERVAQFDLATGTISLLPGSPAAASITPLPNNWYRCRVTATTVAAPSASAVFIRMCDDTGLSSYTGISGRGLYLWGAQVETGSTATAYIPTTTAAVTVFESSWYRQDQSTVYCQGLIPPGLSAFPTLHMASDGSVNNQWSQYAHTSGLYANLRTGNVGQGDPGVIGSPVVGAAYRLATGFNENNVCTAWNGTVGTPDTSASMPTALSEFRIGAARTGGAVINTTISRLTYFPTRLPNATLQQITQ